MVLLRMRPWMVWTLVIALVVTVTIVSIRTMRSNYVTHVSLQNELASSPVNVVPSQLPQEPVPVVEAEPIVQPPTDSLPDYDQRNLPLEPLMLGQFAKAVPAVGIDESEEAGMYSATYGSLLAEVEGLPSPPIFNPVITSEPAGEIGVEEYSKVGFGFDLE